MDEKDKQITEIPSSPSEQNNNRTTNDASTNKEQEIETNEIDSLVFEQQSQNTQNQDIGTLTKISKTTQFSRSAPELFAPIPLWTPSKSIGSLDDINQEMMIAEEKKNITQKNFGSRIKQSKPTYAISSALNETEQKWDKKLVRPTLQKHDSGSPLTVTKRMFNSKSDITSRASKHNISVDEYSQQQIFSQQISDDTVRLSPSPEQHRKRNIAVSLGKAFTRQNILFGLGLVAEFVGIGFGIDFMLKANTFELGLALTCAFGVLLCLTVLFKVCPPCHSSENKFRDVAIQRIDTTNQIDDIPNQINIMNKTASM